ncbi:MAG: hypothetical protein ACI4WG_03875 [Erysipelotrichaceae bacterium]
MKEQIKTYLVTGFIESGKTSYICNCIFHDFFYKYGSTLIISFEQGEIAYPIEKLKQYNTSVIYYQKGDIQTFLTQSIDNYQPDRIYVEDNLMLGKIEKQIDERMKIVFTHGLISRDNFELYFVNMKQMLYSMVKKCDMVTFNRFDDKQQLLAYQNSFRLMNDKCNFLFKSTLGYSEKAFGNLLPYDLNADKLTITEENYAVFFLDCNENYQNYLGKTVDVIIQIRKQDDDYVAGRMVMTCCMADIQFLSFKILRNDVQENMWYHLQAKITATKNQYGLVRAGYAPLALNPVAQPKNLIINVNN